VTDVKGNKTNCQSGEDTDPAGQEWPEDRGAERQHNFNEQAPRMLFRILLNVGPRKASKFPAGFDTCGFDGYILSHLSDFPAGFDTCDFFGYVHLYSFAHGGSELIQF